MPLGASRFGLLGGAVDLASLELIETQTVSSVSSFDFSDLGNYNVHFLTVSDGTNNTGKGIAFRFYENDVLESGSVYQTARQFCTTTTFSENRSFQLIQQLGGVEILMLLQYLEVI